MTSLSGLLYIGLIVGVIAVSVLYSLLPLLIYWRCGDILRRVKRLEGDE